MIAEIICVGTELLMGQIVNTNAQFMAEKLAPLGVDLYRQQVVGDNPQRLTEAVLTAQGKIHPVATILFIAREFVISGLRLVAAGKGVVLAAGNLGKIKTTLQDIALPFMMVSHLWLPFRIVGVVLLYASLVMSLWSGWDYVYTNRKLIAQE